MDEDPSITFPKFFERPAQRVGEPDSIYDLDGVTLQAIRVAADDFLPMATRSGACWGNVRGPTRVTRMRPRVLQAVRGVITDTGCRR